LDKYDIAIIGAGVVGCSIARELAKYQLKICILEKEADVAAGTSKANSAIVHAGYDAKPGTLMSKLNVEGNKMYDELAQELDFHFKRNGSLVLAFSEDEIKILNEIYDRGKTNGVSGLRILTKDEILAKEPAVSNDVKAALYAPSGGITCPYGMVLALAENAAVNGVDVFLENAVTDIQWVEDSVQKEHFYIIKTVKMEIKSRYVINAAGVYADEISKIAGAEEFSITPRKGEYCILDKSVGNIVSHTLFCVPGAMGKGILVTPTVDGNVLIGPNAKDISDKSDTKTTGEGINEVVQGALRIMPGLPVKNVITSFSGLRAVSGKDFIIEESKCRKGFINVAGICSPGLSAAPAIAVYVKDLLKESGLKLVEKKDFNPIRKAIPRFSQMDNESRQALIKKNPLYGRIVCRCEMVTEAEVVEAINRPCGARTLDGVKIRVRAGMGRCQGGFCSPRIVEILSRELGLPYTDITKKGGKSNILLRKTRV